jgi:hypothetical protein
MQYWSLILKWKGGFEMKPKTYNAQGRISEEIASNTLIFSEGYF